MENPTKVEALGLSIAQVGLVEALVQSGLAGDVTYTAEEVLEAQDLARLYRSMDVLAAEVKP